MGYVTIGKTILQFNTLESTNDYLKQLIDKESLEEGTVVQALAQTRGRGQGKNTWESEAGQNLTFSVLLYPGFLEPSAQFFLSMVISLGLTDFACTYTGDISVKWPNDIYAGNRKIAGILIENSVMENRIKDSVLGIGININQIHFGNHLRRPVSLKNLVSRHFSLDECLALILEKTDNWYSKLKGGEEEMIRQTYTGRLYGLNEMKRFKSGKEIFTAAIKGVDDFGRLALERESGGIRYFGLGEIGFLE